MGKNYRKGRLSEEIKKSISSYLLNGIKDPRLTTRIITISGVDVTPDGSYATCYVTPLVLSGEDRNEVCDEVLGAFESAKGMFRKRVSQDIKLRHAPELIFKIDSSMEYGRHIDEIIEEIHNGEEREENDER
jgi:ribosome-binding factor A